MLSKKEIRAEILARRRALSKQERLERSEKVWRQLHVSGLFEGVSLVALYAAADGEVLTRPLYNMLVNKGIRVALPRVRGKGPEIDFYPVADWDSLVPSPLGIPEPAPEGEPIELSALDFVAVPGVAFDPMGGRVGYGMGCYDRVLNQTRPEAPKVGIGYNFQLLEKVPMEEHDVPLTAVAVEARIVRPPGRTG